METKKKQLETQDLMIGDLVRSQEGICRVQEIGLDTSFCIMETCKSVIKYLRKGEYEGIELNESILVDNGFVRTDDNKIGIAYSMNCDGHEIDIVDNEILISSIQNGDIFMIAICVLPQYVHDFQHILRLYGHRDLANNFTVK